MPIRVGYGYDVHRLVTGRQLMLGGVHIPFVQGLDGHSDADVLLHAICDALLGALALGDIGVHFPNHDPRFKDIASLELLKRVAGMVREKGYTVGNIDVTLIAEQPKVAPYTGHMRENVARAAGVGADRISIKATTAEGLGAMGRGEGIAAHAVALLAAVCKEA